MGIEFTTGEINRGRWSTIHAVTRRITGTCVLHGDPLTAASAWHSWAGFPIRPGRLDVAHGRSSWRTVQVVPPEAFADPVVRDQIAADLHLRL